MALITLKDMLAVAQKNKFAVGAFNAIDSHFIDSIFDAARVNNSPVILNVAEIHLKKVSIEDVSAYVKQKAKRLNIPVCLNLDHGMTLPVIETAINNGFSNIMFDGSHLEYEENVKQTRQVVELCSRFGISVEGELGAVGGSEGGDLDGSADELLYTDVSQAEDFVKRTGIDALAVAIGNSHGRYRGVPKLDLSRLKAIHETVNIPLVLHGGSGLSDDDFRQSVLRGICKINFYTGMSQAAIATIQNDIHDGELSKRYDHYLLMMKDVQESIINTVSHQMHVFGSAGKAPLYK